jgi:hypothetical protein
MTYEAYSSDNMNRKMSPNIKYRYNCENEGVFMISTKNFDDFDIRISCLD